MSPIDVPTLCHTCSSRCFNVTMRFWLVTNILMKIQIRLVLSFISVAVVTCSQPAAGRHLQPLTLEKMIKYKVRICSMDHVHFCERSKFRFLSCWRRHTDAASLSDASSEIYSVSMRVSSTSFIINLIIIWFCCRVLFPSSEQQNCGS